MEKGWDLRNLGIKQERGRAISPPTHSQLIPPLWHQSQSGADPTEKALSSSSLNYSQKNTAFPLLPDSSTGAEPGYSQIFTFPALLKGKELFYIHFFSRHGNPWLWRGMTQAGKKGILSHFLRVILTRHPCRRLSGIQPHTPDPTGIPNSQQPPQSMEKNCCWWRQGHIPKQK